MQDAECGVNTGESLRGEHINLYSFFICLSFSYLKQMNLLRSDFAAHSVYPLTVPLVRSPPQRKGRGSEKEEGKTEIEIARRGET